MNKVIIRTLIVVCLLGAGYGAFWAVRKLPDRQEEVATTQVRRGDVLIRTYARGELQAVRSVTLTAPNLFGTVQVTRLAPLGSFAREKDLIVEFDDAEVRSRLEEKQLELEQIDEQIKRSQADLDIRDNQDEVDLLKARYGVRRGELEVQRNELLSQIDAKKNVLNLEEARRRLEQLESDIKSRRQQAEAQLAVLREQKNKALLELQREQHRLTEVKLLSPINGLVAVKPNRGAGMMFGMQVPDIREGDELSPGTPVADVLDISELEVLAKVGEIDRANLKEGQEVVLGLDAIPNKEFRGRIKSLSGTASSNVFSGDPSKKFDVTFSIDMKQLLEALGAKPEEILRALAQEELNRKRPPLQAAINRMADVSGMSADTGGAAPQQAGGQVGGQVGGAPRPVASGQQRPSAGAGATAAAAKNPAQRLGGPGGPQMPLAASPLLQFSEKDIERAELPPPPEQDKQLSVLLRPGLLADVQIIVERIQNAIHIPNQAVFESEGKPIVYVKQKGRFEPRPIKPLKQSESTLVVAEGLKPGEVIALADPTAKPGEKKNEKPGEGKAMSMPTGGGK